MCLKKGKVTINQIDYISSSIKNLDKYEITEDEYYLSLKKEILKNFVNR